MPSASARSSVPQSARAAVVGLSVALFVIALFLPALEFHGVNGSYVNSSANPGNAPGFDPTLDLWKGSTALISGMFGILDMDLAGYANPLLWAAWVLLLLNRLRAAAWCALIAGALSLLTFRLFSSPIPEDEGGVKHAILTHLHAGAWLWFASIFVALLAGIIWWSRQLPTQRTPVAYPSPLAYPPPPNPNTPPPPPNPNLHP